MMRAVALSFVIINSDKPARMKQTAVLNFIAGNPETMDFKSGISKIHPANTENPVTMDKMEIDLIRV